MITKTEDRFNKRKEAVEYSKPKAIINKNKSWNRRRTTKQRITIKNKTKMKNKKNWTEEQVEFVLENYVVNPNKCVNITGHSLGSIKALLKNISYDYTGKGLANGNPMYTEVCTKFMLKNNMSINKFVALYF